ncbi:MAG TPA: DUF1028 domain-containing protein [Actinomycetota bacterium]|nr:DUF1028 domain-containing protein [Actinomycetota bacterium]
MTFSIVACDTRAEPSPEWGVAVASKFLAVGAVVPWAAAGAGAVATQAFANLSYGPRGLEALARGEAAEEVVRRLTEEDDEREQRQLGIVDAQGRAATFTGSECFSWAGGVRGDGFCCQGNILTGPDVVDRMAETFSATPGDLASRLLAALRAGDEAGGDKRGRQGAALLVVREGGGYGGGTDKALDLRADDHPRPVEELDRLLDLHRLYFPRPSDLRFVDIDEELANRLRRLLSAAGYDPRSEAGPYDQGLRDALYAYMGTENLEERWSEDAKIEAAVLDHLTSTDASRGTR